MERGVEVLQDISANMWNGRMKKMRKMKEKIAAGSAWWIRRSDGPSISPYEYERCRRACVDGNGLRRVGRSDV